MPRSRAFALGMLLAQAVLAGALIGGAARAATKPTSVAVETDLLVADLVAETTTARPGTTLHVALRQKIAPGWHSYWRNPGEGGRATSIAWMLPKGWEAGEMIWPTPERFALGPLTNFVYSDTVLLPVPIAVPADARPGARVTLKARADFLLCKDVCIPERADVALTIVVSDTAPVPNGVDGQAVAATRADVSGRPRISAVYRSVDGAMTLAFPGVSGPARDAFFYPYATGSIDPNKPQATLSAAEGLVLGAASDPQATGEETVSGVLALASGRAYEIVAQPGPLPRWAETASPAIGPAQADDGVGVWSAAMFAFLGGLILNFMPCVFPVLSLKAMALAKHAGRPTGARIEGLAFLAGTLVAFLGLAGVLIAARAAGAQIGWGFQLQSPAVVTVLALVMLLSGLNLSGVFEVGLSLQRVGGRLSMCTGALGAFFTGALAAVVAAPCTAPLMGPAIGWGLTQPPQTALLIFAALGSGLATPVTLLSFTPGLIRHLPRSGAWLERLKKGLAFPMYGAAAWLAWVLSLQTGGAGLPALFAAAVTIAFAAWSWGLVQRGASLRGWGAVALVAAATALPLGVAAARADRPAAGDLRRIAPGPVAERWSPARVTALREAGHPVLVDFTAAWCVTCQINERAALSSPAVADAFARAGAAYLKADWTNPDPQIAAALAAHGRSGVPLYLVYGAGTEPKVLPQILTERMVIDAIEEAATCRKTTTEPSGK